MLEHLENDELALGKIYSLLKKNGIAILSVPSRNAPLHKLGYTRGFDKRVGHVRRYTLDQLKSKVKQAGFTMLYSQKSEGILRNFLFLNTIVGKSIRFIRFQISDIVSLLDQLFLKLFGESQIIIVIRKK